MRMEFESCDFSEEGFEDFIFDVDEFRGSGFAANQEDFDLWCDKHGYQTSGILRHCYCPKSRVVNRWHAFWQSKVSHEPLPRNWILVHRVNNETPQ